MNKDTYKILYEWFFGKGRTVPTDAHIQEAKEYWISINKDNSDPVISQLVFLNYFQDEKPDS